MITPRLGESASDARKRLDEKLRKLVQGYSAASPELHKFMLEQLEGNPGLQNRLLMNRLELGEKNWLNETFALGEKMHQRLAAQKTEPKAREGEEFLKSFRDKRALTVPKKKKPRRRLRR